MNPSPDKTDHAGRGEFTPRVIAIGLVYIFLSGSFENLIEFDHVDPAFAFCFVVFGAGAIMMMLSLLCRKWFLAENAKVQFDLASIFQIIVPLSIYLTAIRIRLNTHDPQTTLDYVLFVIGSLVFVTIATLILLWGAEAIFWFASQLFKSQNRNS